jgi:adenine/guanine phosphoribosyltransferase-like PRPP-binding protein
MEEENIIVPEFNEESPIEEIESYLRYKFYTETVVKNKDKGFLSIEFINQIIRPEPKIAASIVLIQQLQEQNMLENIDYIVEIPKFGTYLGSTISDRTKIPMAPVSKDGKIRGQWEKIIELEDAVPSFTTGIPSSYIINGLQLGDRILLVDDFIAHGETATHFIKKLQENGVTTVAVASYVIKFFQQGYNKILQETGVQPIGAIGVDGITEDRKIILSKGIYSTLYNPTPTP